MTRSDDADAPPAHALTTDQVESREQDLQSGLADLAALVTSALPLAELLVRVASSAVQAIPGADGVGVTLLRLGPDENRVQSLAASHPFVTEIDLVQYELLDEGPCITAAAERAVALSGAVGSDERWPRFGPRVARLGVQSVLSLPMLLPDGTTVGAVNAYSRSADAFDGHSVAVGRLFAAPAGVAVHNAHVLEQARAQAAQLQTALVSRAVIDQAIGILRSRSGDSAEEAFARLRTISQSENVKLSVVAERVVDEAVRRARARHTQA
jgi:GAF domain-containing protein